MVIAYCAVFGECKLNGLLKKCIMYKNLLKLTIKEINNN